MDASTATSWSEPSPVAPSARQLSVQAQLPDFEELVPKPSGANGSSIDLLLDVSVTVTVELGRAALSIADVLKIGVGSVVELDRAVAEPVDLMVQGKCVARGEVVVVDGRFAIQIKEITDPRRR